MGEFNLRNLLAVVASLYANGVALKSIVALIPLLNTPLLGVWSTSKIPVVTSGCDFAHTPDALKNVLKALRPHTPKKLWCVFGCGGDRDRENDL